MYEHSGITIKTTPFNCRFDSGLIGFIYCSKEKAKSEYKDKNYLQKSIFVLELEIKALNKYLTGDVWFYKITDINKLCDLY